MAGIVTTIDFDGMLADGTVTGKDYVDRLVGNLSEDVVHVEAFSGLFAKAVTDTGLVKEAALSAYVAKDDFGKLISGITISADQIKLEGLVTANENFKILQDGSIETNNAKLKGYLYSVFKPIESSDAEYLGGSSITGGGRFKLRTNLFVDATFCTVILPVSESYEGARVLIMDSYFLKTRTPHDPTVIKTENGSGIVSGLFVQSRTGMEYKAEELTIDAGVVELILQNMYVRDPNTGEVTSDGLHWVLIGNSCHNLYWTDRGRSYGYRYNIDNYEN